MKLELKITTCNDPQFNCQFNPEHKSICPVANEVACNSMRDEVIVHELDKDDLIKQLLQW